MAVEEGKENRLDCEALPLLSDLDVSVGLTGGVAKLKGVSLVTFAVREVVPEGSLTGDVPERFQGPGLVPTGLMLPVGEDVLPKLVEEEKSNGIGFEGPVGELKTPNGDGGMPPKS